MPDPHLSEHSTEEMGIGRNPFAVRCMSSECRLEIELAAPGKIESSALAIYCEGDFVHRFGDADFGPDVDRDFQASIEFPESPGRSVKIRALEYAILNHHFQSAGFKITSPEKDFIMVGVPLDFKFERKRRRPGNHFPRQNQVVALAVEAKHPLSVFLDPFGIAADKILR